MIRVLERFLLAGLLAAVFLAPWMFGAVEPWAIHALTALLLILLALWGVKAVLERAVRVHVTPIHGVLAGALLVAALQLTRAPSLSPETVGSGAPAIVRTGASQDPSGTRRAMWRLALLSGYFGLAIELLRSTRRMAAAFVVLLLLGFSLALVGLVQKLAGSERLLWVREVEAAEIAFGPFVNRNHAAGFLEMLFPLPVAAILGRGVARERWGICAVLALVMGIAIALTGSRGGVLVLGVQMLALPLLWRAMNAGADRRLRSGVLIVALLSAGISAGVLWIGAEPIVSRWRMPEDVGATLSNPPDRPRIWRATGEMIRDHFWGGVGLGAYPVAYTRYDRSTGFARVEQAHNDYLQLVAELGVSGVLLLLGLLFALWRATWRALARVADSPTARFERALALGVTVALLGVGIHSAFDFGLQVTANALLFLLLVALLENLGAQGANRQLIEEKGI
ncbi:MAG: O-antigen ligase family protein [Blastocatellia bacterium]|nr:O-antigen ligase family protein [Blastocatellia bacterium]MDW8255554.1 O-antigen ligase family protein [Acidobacteriota bacterium]